MKKKMNYAICGLLALTIISGCGSSDSGGGDEKGKVSIKEGKSLDDLTVGANGVFVKLYQPVDSSLEIKYIDDTKEVKKDKSIGVQVKKPKAKQAPFILSLKNNTSKTIAAEDAMVEQISVANVQDIKLKLPNGITQKSKYEDFLEAYGTPTQYNTYIDSTGDEFLELMYESSTKDRNGESYRFVFYDGEFASLTLYASSDEKKEPKDVSFDMAKNFGYSPTFKMGTPNTAYSDVLINGTVTVDGVTIKNNDPISLLLNSGWTVGDANDFEKFSSIRLDKGDNVIHVDVPGKFTSLDTVPAETPMTGINVSKVDLKDSVLTYPAGISATSSIEEIIAAYGFPSQIVFREYGPIITFAQREDGEVTRKTEFRIDETGAITSFSIAFEDEF